MPVSPKPARSCPRSPLLALAPLSLSLLLTPLLVTGCGGDDGMSEARMEEYFLVTVLRRNQEECARLSRRIANAWWDLSYGHAQEGTEGIPPRILRSMRGDRARAAAVIERLEREIDALRSTARPEWVTGMDELMVNHRITCRVFLEPVATFNDMTRAGTAGRSGYDTAWRRHRKRLRPSRETEELLAPRRDQLFDEVYAAAEDRMSTLDAERAREERREMERRREEYRAHLKAKEEREERRARARREAMERRQRRSDPPGGRR